MNSRERVERAINFEQPDRVPFNFWMDRRKLDALEEKYGPNFRLKHYDADVVEAFCGLAWPAGEFEAKLGTSWMVKPLIDDWTKASSIALPDPDDDTLLDPLKAALAEHPDRAVVLDFPNVLTYVEMMISQEHLYMDMMDYADEIQAFFTRMSEIMRIVAEKAVKLDITALYVMDDIGCNKGMIMSPAMWREFVYPHWKKVIDVARSAKKPVFFHTDGNVQDLWEEFHQLGVRMLNPLQPNLQPLDEYKRLYHGKMGVYGGLPTDRLHEMEPDQIRQTVAELFATVGAGGGLIMSTHDIDHTMTETQLDAMVDAIKNCRY